MHGVEVRVVEVPELDVVQTCQRDRVTRGVGLGLEVCVDRCAGERVHGRSRVLVTRGRVHRMAALGDRPLAVLQFHLQRHPPAGRHWLARQKSSPTSSERASLSTFSGAREDVVQVGLGDDPQRNLAVDAAEGHVVDLVTEGRHIVAFGGVERYHQHVLAVSVQVRGQFEGEGRKAALVLAQGGSVEPHRRGRHRSLEVYEDALSARRRRKPGSGGDRWRRTRSPCRRSCATASRCWCAVKPPDRSCGRRSREIPLRRLCLRGSASGG